MKYKLTFSIDAAALFGIIGRMLPIEDLEVEELTPPIPQQAIRFDKRLDLPKPKPKGAPRGKSGNGVPTDITHGVNAIIMGVFADRQAHKYGEIRRAVAATHFSASGIGSRLSRLIEHGYINKISAGRYRATPKGVPNSPELERKAG